jgi:hypothetical protein
VVGVSCIIAFSGQVSGASLSSGNGMKVSPVRTDLVLKPGQSKTFSVYVQNITNGDEILKVITNDFVSRDETGSPSLLLDGEANPSHGLKQYMITPKTITIPKGKQEAVSVTVKIPANAAGGGYYGAVRFAPANSNSNASGDNVSLAGSVASLILVRVPGDINEDLQLASLSAAKNGNTGTIFTSGSGMQAIIRFRNAGNVQEQPFGKVVLKKGDKTLGTYDVNNVTPPGNVIPDSIRRFNVDLKEKVGSFGKYTLIGNFGYGENGQLLSGTTTFYVIPMYMIIGFIVLILAIIALIFGLKGYKKRILRRARRR